MSTVDKYLIRCTISKILLNTYFETDAFESSIVFFLRKKYHCVLIVHDISVFLILLINEDFLLYDFLYCNYFHLSLEYDVDGKTLEMMNNVERISVVIPKFKQQLIFLEEREKLFKTMNDCSTESSNTSFRTSTNPEPISIVSLDSQASSLESKSTPDTLPKPSINKSSSSPSVREKPYEDFPKEYEIPTLPNAVLNDIAKGDLKNFGPHCANRQILIDAVAFDLIDKFNLL